VPSLSAQPEQLSVNLVVAISPEFGETEHVPPNGGSFNFIIVEEEPFV
jgi:hypothetical protein